MPFAQPVQPPPPALPGSRAGIPPLTPLLTALFFDRALSPELLRSYARLVACAWASGYRSLGPLDLAGELVPLLGVSKSQVYAQLRQLRLARLLDWETDGQRRYTLYFLDQEVRSSGLPGRPECVVVGESFNSLTEIHQQQTQSGQTISPAQAAPAQFTALQPGRSPSGPAPSDPTHSGRTPSTPTPAAPAPVQSPPPDLQALRFLRRAGVWSEVAERLARQLAANQQSSDQDYLPDRRDVLGWIVYCFPERQKNRIAQPAAVLAANLRNNRRCPEAYRPPWICAACHRQLEYCQCAGAPQPHLPEEFLEFALRPEETYTLDSHPRWRVCHACRSFPCQCQAAEADWDDEEAGDQAEEWEGEAAEAYPADAEGGEAGASGEEWEAGAEYPEDDEAGEAWEEWEAGAEYPADAEAGEAGASGEAGIASEKRPEKAAATESRRAGPMGEPRGRPPPPGSVTVIRQQEAGDAAEQAA